MMSQQTVQQRFQERENELKELQQAAESLKVSVVHKRRHTISLLSSSQREREREGPISNPTYPTVGNRLSGPLSENRLVHETDWAASSHNHE